MTTEVENNTGHCLSEERVWELLCVKNKIVGCLFDRKRGGRKSKMCFYCGARRYKIKAMMAKRKLGIQVETIGCKPALMAKLAEIV